MGLVHANQAENEGKHGLHYAAQFSDAGTVWLLALLTKAPHCVSTSDGKTALYCAARHRDGSTAEATIWFLLEDRSFDVDAVDTSDTMVIQYAADVVTLLLQSKAEHDRVDKSGKTMLHCATTPTR